MSVRTPMEWSDVAAQRRDHDSLMNWFERLIRRRRECPELGFGKLALLETGAPSVLAHRCDWEGSTVVAVHELAGRAVEVALGLDDGETLVDLFEEAEHPLPATLALAPYAARWFRVRRAGVPLPP
jgi:maltose alpha-D-glucosyltransferase/alpha-amylase